MPRTTRYLAAMLLAWPATLTAQDSRADSLAVLAVADSSLAALSRNDFVGFTDWMVEGATIASVSESAQGRRVNLRTREGFRSRDPGGDRLLERGFNGTAMVDGPIAMVWLPYDFYVNGTWSHCGVDIFTMVKSDAGWKIATLTYNVLQPPACAPHPDGPPK
jgi:hypothetical protein